MPRQIEIIKNNITLTDEVEVVYEKTVTRFGTSAKLDAPKKIHRQKSIRYNPQGITPNFVPRSR